VGEGAVVGDGRWGKVVGGDGRWGNVGEVVVWEVI